MNNQNKPISIEYVPLESQDVQNFIVGQSREGVLEVNANGSRNEDNWEEKSSTGKALLTSFDTLAFFYQSKYLRHHPSVLFFRNIE